MAAGGKAAASIDKYLGGSGNIEKRLVYVEEPSLCLGPDDGFADRERVSMPCLSLEQRRGNFAEVELGFDGQAAGDEACRCLQCDLRLKATMAAPPKSR